jgi:alkyl hydroperoxide reductase subunit AhpC
MDCKITTLLVDPVDSHERWLEDVEAMGDNKTKVRFPIIADPSRDISMACGMIDPWTSDKQDLPLTIR